VRMRLLSQLLVGVPSAVVAASTLIAVDRLGIPTFATAAVTVGVFYATAYVLAVPIGIAIGVLRSLRAARRG
jgi:ABC-type nitrate/sulfonate/bicarbonate transport system permease component